MRGWFDPSPLAVFVIGIALLAAAATGGMLRLPPIGIRGPLSPFAIKAVAVLGTLCLLVSGGIALATTTDPPPSPTPTPSAPYTPSSPPPSPPESTPTPTPPTTSPQSSDTPTPTPVTSPDGIPKPTTYLQDVPPLGSPNGLNRNPSLKMGKVFYPHSVAVACVREDTLVAYDVGEYSSLHATIGVGNDDAGPGRADDIACEITISNNAQGILKTVTIKPSQGPQTFDVDLKGSSQMKIACVPVSKTRAGYDVNYKIGFGNAELRQ